MPKFKAEKEKKSKLSFVFNCISKQTATQERDW